MRAPLSPVSKPNQLRTAYSAIDDIEFRRRIYDDSEPAVDAAALPELLKWESRVRWGFLVTLPASVLTNAYRLFALRSTRTSLNGSALAAAREVTKVTACVQLDHEREGQEPSHRGHGMNYNHLELQWPWAAAGPIISRTTPSTYDPFANVHPCLS